MDGKSDISQDILAELKNINFLLDTLVKIQLIPVIKEELHDKTRQRIYELTGEKTVKEIATMLNISVGTVSQTWTRWEQLGIITKVGKGYRKIIE